MTMAKVFAAFPSHIHFSDITFAYFHATWTIFIYTILPKVLAPLLMKGLTTLVISKSTNLNVEAYDDILGNLMLWQQFGQNPFLF